MFLASPSVWAKLCSLVFRGNFYGITICLINALFTCVKGCSWYHYLWAMLWSLVSREVHDITISLSYSVLTCVQGHSLYHRMWSYALFACIQGGSWHHHLSRLFCAHLCPGMFLISPSVWIICCAHLCQWVFMALPPLWAMLCSLVSRNFMASPPLWVMLCSLVSRNFMASPSVWSMLCLLVSMQELHGFTICLSYAVLCSLMSRDVHVITIFLSYTVLTCVQERPWRHHLSELWHQNSNSNSMWQASVLDSKQ